MRLLFRALRPLGWSISDNRADPKSVQELLGRKTLTMTMNLYTKINATNKQEAIAKLSYGAGSHVPDQVLELATHPLPAKHLAGVAEWQTRWIQNPVSFGT